MEEQIKPITHSFLAELLVNFGTALIIFFLFYYFIAQTHEVHGASMQPTFVTGDRVITEKVSKYFNSIHRGDVVVLKSPEHDEPLIKRVIALPNETVEILDGDVLIDGVVLTEPYIDDEVKTFGQRFLKEKQAYTLGADEYLVMGDNRPVSSDSRSWGAVTEREIIGHVFFRYWPLNGVGFIPSN